MFHFFPDSRPRVHHDIYTVGTPTTTPPASHHRLHQKCGPAWGTRVVLPLLEAAATNQPGEPTCLDPLRAKLLSFWESVSLFGQKHYALRAQWPKSTVRSLISTSEQSTLPSTTARPA